MRFRGAALWLAAIGLLASAPAVADALERAECIAPAKPGGGFDIACRLVQTILHDARLLKAPMKLSYVPGGIGAVAYNMMAAQRPGEENVLVAYSSGSLLNLAQGKFGAYTERDVRWLATVAADYGAIVVARDSPIRSLRDLAAQLKRDPSKVVFGGGGSIGGQDWMKAALVARAVGMDFKSIRFVAFEGGGEAITALRGGHIHVFSGDVAESFEQMERGAPIRILAVLSEARLHGRLSNVPTAIEQGVDVRWRIARGVYMGPRVSDVAYKEWEAALAAAMRAPTYRTRVEELGMLPLAMTGDEARLFAERSVAEYKQLALQFGLRIAQQ